MRSIRRYWINLSVSRKLYAVVGIMAFLIAGELLTLRFAMTTLSAVRAFVGGESLWAKAQKNAVFHLQRYGVTRDERDYQRFLDELKVPEGDHRARMELMKPEPDMAALRDGFLAGKIHSDDIQPMFDLLRRFYWVRYLAMAIGVWAQGDETLDELRAEATRYHDAIRAGEAGRESADAAMERIREYNDRLTQIEAGFSDALGEGSRWLERVVLTLLLLAVLLVESVGITLTFLTTRALSRSLKELTQAAGDIGRGMFGTRLEVRSRDELGQLAVSVNEMGELLSKSYSELESRVQERTKELSLLAAQNKGLYEETRGALVARDEFLSVASHELRTPLTSLQLGLQHLKRSLDPAAEVRPGPPPHEVADRSLKQTQRLIRLVDELLDLTRLRLGRLELSKQSCDLRLIVSTAADELRGDAERHGSSIRASLPVEAVLGHWDPVRLSQIVTNLLSNAIRYGKGSSIELGVAVEQEWAELSVRDHGPGIAAADQERIFERFERASTDYATRGLGLGLYITRQVVEAHGGTIRVSSTVGQGAMFVVRLPRKEPAKVAVGLAHPDDADAAAKRS